MPGHLLQRSVGWELIFHEWKEEEERKCVERWMKNPPKRKRVSEKIEWKYPEAIFFAFSIFSLDSFLSVSINFFNHWRTQSGFLFLNDTKFSSKCNDGRKLRKSLSYYCLLQLFLAERTHTHIMSKLMHMKLYWNHFISSHQIN